MLDSAGHEGLCDGSAGFVYKGHLIKQEDSELGSSHNRQGQRHGQNLWRPREEYDPVGGRGLPGEGPAQTDHALSGALGVPESRVHIGSAPHTLGLGQSSPNSELCSYYT